MLILSGVIDTLYKFQEVKNEKSTYEAAIQKAKEDTEIFDYTQGILTMVDVDFAEYRRKHDNRMVKKNCTNIKSPTLVDSEF